VVIACDNRHYWRRDVYPYYKASRKKSRDSSGHDWSSIFDALHLIRSELDEFMPYPVLDIDGAEADDVIGALAEYSQTSKEGALFDEPEPVLIISGDHDFQQLQKFSNVQQYSPMKKKMVKLTESPQEVLMEHIITGDKGDGVPNILSPDDTFVTEGKRQKPIRKNLLAEWKKQKPEEFITGEMASGYVRNKQLVDLSMTPQEIKDDVISSYEKQKGKSRAQLLNYFIKYRLKNMIEVAEDF
jgi:5'-3' exonuclease